MQSSAKSGAGTTIGSGSHGPVEAFQFDRDRLFVLADALHEGYASAQPFPHAVMDAFLDEDVLDAVLAEFPKPGEDWFAFDSPLERKLATKDDSTMGPATRRLLSEFNSSAFVDFLERLTGIDGLVPDPHFEGGGLHQIEPGGHLKIHADFNRHPRTELERRLNVLMYLNRDWKDEYGGALELWPSPLAAEQGQEREDVPIRSGHIVARPPSSRVAHSFRAGDEGLTLLLYGTRRANDVCYYPRSNKLFWRGLGVIGRVEPLDYWDGED